MQGTWWQRGIIYQVYPRSFMDSNGDGIGDLPGLIRKLDYLAWLGIDAIWLSPIFPSPMADFGYDISNYTDIHPLFGTLADFDRLLAEAHGRHLKVILDYVPNHTSDQHPWFAASRSSRRHPKRAWYIWCDAAPDGGPPNNWRSVFGGSAWEWDATTEQYYYHAYLKAQPDLNWRNPEVQTAMLDVLRFWLERGVDGFRVDALRQLIKDDQRRDNPPNLAYHLGQGPYDALLPVHTTDRPEIQAMIALMRHSIDMYEERLLVGELYLPIERLVTYYGVRASGVHLPFNFHLIHVPWQARAIERLIEAYEAALPPGAWPNWVLGNHDQHRLASRIGMAQARVAAMLLLTLRGTPTLYYGDELGMADVTIPLELTQDPWEKNVPGLGLGRDPERTPMQWDDSPNAGFTAGSPWLPIATDYGSINVARARQDPLSILTLYRRLIALRRATPALSVGSYIGLQAHSDVLAYVRAHAGQRCLVVLNLGAQSQAFESHQWDIRGHVVLSTHLDRTDEAVRRTIKLRGDEGLIVRLE
ncbi:MAG TPA: alpha-amylase family glycosyl hydrolase [Candidatus Tectomicrobia bacterium]|nr:alpha-amylase family glycosyl hydrolase [Candidatus Tectomicrobia bacterium]